MRKSWGVASIVLLLLAWSYFARPIYDFLWIAAKRGRDKVAEKVKTDSLAVEAKDVISLNTRLVSEMDTYIAKTRELSTRSPLLTGIQYSSVDAFAASTEPLRAELRRSVGYPLPDAIHGNDFSGVETTALGEDDLATYTLLNIPALGSAETGIVHAAGVLIIPKKHEAKMPIIIAAHGRGGMPEIPPSGKLPILTPIDRDLARGAVERGWAVFEPVYVFYGKGYPKNIRERLIVRAQQAGRSLIAMEFTKTIRSIDYLLSRPEFDANRLAMVGMSYGGFNTLYTTALDPRIRAAVVAAYFSDRNMVLSDSEIDFLDWRYLNSTGIFQDENIAALICPRPLQIQSGTQDQLFPAVWGRETVARTRETYRKLGLENEFNYYEFVGRHDFIGTAAWTFLDRQFQP